MNIFVKGWKRWMGAALLAAGWLPGAASGANVLQTFFVPLPEDDMQISLNAVDAFAGNIGVVMESVIGMAVGTDRTIIYYDQWEDGYEADITSPTQLTSQVWGDANPDNGYPPDIPSDVLDAGTVVRLEDQIDVTRNSVTIEYDGRDKVAVTQPIAMTRAMYPVDPGEVIAEAIGVRDIGSHGTVYRAPVGEGTGTGANTNEMFSTSSLYVMGDYDFTRIEIDANADGVFETTVYLDQGEPYFVNGGVKAGATVRGSQPFQCSLITGDVGSNYETRWFELWPETQWDSDYFTPVCSRTNAAGTTYAAHVYLFNPNAAAITVTVTTATSTGSIAIAANAVGAPFQMPLNGGARFVAAGGSPFIGVSLFDTAGSCQDYDWGISLVPEKMMSTAGLVGWGPGYGTTGAGANGNPVWVSALSNTTLYVDYDADPTTGAVTDPQGNRCDLATNVAALQTIRLLDASDDDQSGLRYYTTDGTVLLGAWGEDSALAGTGNPYLDMGYAIPAFPTVISKKFATLLNDVNENGYPDAGDTLEYLVDVVNVGFATASHVIFEDNPPTNLTTYVTNSAMLAAAGATNDVPDSLPPKLTRFPFDEGGCDVGTIGLGQTTTVRYVTQIVTNLPVDFTGYIHNNATVGGTNGNWTTGSSTNVMVGGLAISKAVSTTNLLTPGTNFTYTVTVVNTGAVTYTGVRIDDDLPLGLTYVSNSTRIALSGVQTNTVHDRFDERAFTNDDGTVPWLTAWAEGGEADGVAAGYVRVLADVLANSAEAFVLEIAGASRSATRSANLSGQGGAALSFRYLRDALDDANDAVSVFISTNNWASSNLVVRIQGAGTDAAYVSTNFNVSAYMSTNTAIRFLSTASLGTTDYVRFDDVKFVLVGTNATVAGAAPPILAEDVTLLPGSTATVTFAVMVDNPPVATQTVNSAQVRADQSRTPLDSNPVTNRINATEGVLLQKTSSTTNLLTAGTSVVYAIRISNTGTVAQTGIRLEDLLPFGTTYSNGTAQLYRPFAHTNVFLDRFDLQTFTNSDGNVAWAGPWTEVYDDAVATNGNVRMAVDGTSIPGQTYAVRTASTSLFQRAANLAGYTSATLQFSYRRSGLEAGDYVNVNVSSNGGGTFVQVGQIGGATNDGSYFTASFNVSAYASTGTVIRFGGNASRDANDFVWLDNVRISASAANATNALPDPPLLLDDYALPPGTNMTVYLTATVDDPITATEFVNAARLLSDQQTTWITARVTNAASGKIGMRLTKVSALATNWNYGVTNDYYLTIENTGTVTLVGIQLTDALPAGVNFATNGAALVQFETVTTNAFAETVSDVFSTAAYNNNDGTTNWFGNWIETGDDGNATTGSELIRTANGTNALVFENSNADNDSVTRSNQLATTRAGRTYTNVTLSLAYRRQNWDAGDTLTVYLSTNNFAAQTQVFAVPTTSGTDAGYVTVTTHVTTGMSAHMGLRLRAGGNFNTGDRINFDFVTFTNQGFDVVTNVVAQYSNASQIVVVSNLTADLTNLLDDYSLPPGSSVTVRVRGTLGVPLVATQLVNVATATNAQTAPATAAATNYSAANRVGDVVWHDVDGNGLQSGVEPGIAGATVRLYDAVSNLLLTATSGVDGAYAFTDLPSGSYFLEFATPSNYLATAQDQGGDDALDSDVGTNTGRTAVFALSGGTNDATRDAGFYQPSSAIGDFVWRDVDGDGLQDGGSETGMPGVVVTLYDAASNAVGATTSSATGAYAFSNLTAGTYFLQFAAPSNYTYTLQDQGGSDAADSDVSPATGFTAAFYLPPGTTDASRDAGFAAIVRGLRLTKTSSAGSCLTVGNAITYTLVVQNTGTVAQTGIALYDPLPNGLAYVTGSVTWAGGTLATAGPPPNLLVNLRLTNSQSATVTVQAVVSSPATVTQLLNAASAYSAVQPAIYAAVTNCVQFADVGVSKFVTTNAPDPVQIIEYVLVATNRGPNAATGVQIADVLPAQLQYNGHSNGNYNAGTGAWTIGTLAANAATTLYVNVTVRENTSGMQITNVAAISGRDLYDPVASNDSSSVVIVPKGGAAIGDRVWFDDNGNGIQDAAEIHFIANLPVALLDAAGNVLRTTNTDSTGTYLFAGLASGTYRVRFDMTDISSNVVATTANAGGDDAQDSDATNGATAGHFETAPISITAGATNRTVDFGFASLHSTRAEVAEVWGEWTENGGQVVWRTSSEWNTAGFFVYRIDPETGAETRLNEQPVPAAFNETGATYRQTDPEACERGTGTYRLEELELSDTRLDLGAHAATFGAPRPAPKSAAASLWLGTEEDRGPSSVLKTTVGAEGLYGVALADVAAGMGRPADEIRALAASNALCVFGDGRLVPTLFDAARDRLVFHGGPAANWYARVNAYLIYEGRGLAMPRRAPGADGGAAVFATSIRFEEDRYPGNTAVTAKPDDFYYWKFVMNSTNAAANQAEFPFVLTGHGGGALTLTVDLIGWLQVAARNPDHLVAFALNGVPVGTAEFEGQEAFTAELDVPAGIAFDGTNVLAVSCREPTNLNYFVVDGFTATYDRTLVSSPGTAHFAAPAGTAISAAAYEEPLAVALDRDGGATWIADENGKLPAKAWTATADDARFALAEADGIPSLAPVAAAADAWFLSETNRIDYLVVAPRAFTNAVRELADYRAAQGLRVGVAAFEDVCDLLAGGLRTPEAIPELLAYAASSWAEAPWMVLLAGNGHYDYLNALSNEVNHLPPLLFAGSDGLFAADERLADSGGDELPDVAIGRLPALTTNDLAAMIAKIKAYEAGFGQNWQNQIVLANDVNDAAAGDFKAANERIAARTDAKHPLADVVDLNVMAIAPARNKLLAYFNSGAGFIHYTGHGGVANWSKLNLLKAADVAGLNNPNRPPIVVALSCLVGRYEAPGVNSLGELLLRKAGGGAVAVWGPAGLSRNEFAAELGAAFYRAVTEEGAGTLGRAILLARRRMAPETLADNTYAVYNLLGDPALRIADNVDARPSAENFAQWRWDRFAPADLTNAAVSGATKANFADYALEGEEPVAAELPEFGFALPNENGKQDGFVFRWKRRAKRADVDYQLYVSEDAVHWEADSADMEEVGTELDANGVMETVRTRVNRPRAERIFLGVKAKKK